jgi:hypothetical protein
MPVRYGPSRQRPIDDWQVAVKFFRVRVRYFGVSAINDVGATVRAPPWKKLTALTAWRLLPPTARPTFRLPRPSPHSVYPKFAREPGDRLRPIPSM